MTTSIRVENCSTEPEELAAITAVLIAFLTTRPLATRTSGPPTKATWRRLERTRGFDVPHSWQQPASHGD